MKELLVQAWKEWNDDNAPRLGAALAYYTILSIAPLLVIVIAIAGLIFGREAVQGQLYVQIQGLVGNQGARAIETMIAGSSNIGHGLIAAITGTVALVLGATTVVIEIRNDLNIVWDVPGKQNTGVTGLLKDKSSALVIILGCGFILLVSLVVSAGVAALGTFFAGVLTVPTALIEGVNFVVSIAVITGVFVLLFKFIPDVRLEWGDVLVGAAFTAVLFTIGKFALGMYLGKASFGSTFGAAGSLVIVLVWVYYSAQILFFGAEFTQVYAREHGSDPLKRRQSPETRETGEHVKHPVEYAKHAAIGNTGLMAARSGIAERSRGRLVGGAMIVAVVAAAANEVKQLFNKRHI